MKKLFTLLVLLTALCHTGVVAQTQHSSPAIAHELCNKAPITVTQLTSVGSGGVPKPLCFAANIRQPYWFVFTPSVSGTFEFVAQSQQTGIDLDFALYDGPPQSGAPSIACNYAQPFLPTGMTDNPGLFGTFFNPGIEPSQFVLAGVTYYLLIDNYSVNSVGFTIVFGGSFKLSATDANDPSDSPKDARFCETAPVFDCSCLSWFESGTELEPYSSSVPGFLASVENPHLYRFVACACIMDFTVTINGQCVTGFGLEAQVLSAAGDCSGALLTNVTQGQPGSPCQLSATNLNVGQEYYLVIDGINGASCPYVVEVQPYTPPPLVHPDTIYSETSYYCEGDTMVFSITPVQNIGNCYWIPPPGYDTLQPTHDTLIVIAGHGNGQPQQVCIHLENGCGDEVTICRTIVVYPDNAVNVVVPLCPNDFPYNFNGQLLTSVGEYYDTLNTVHGCDSLVHLTLTASTNCLNECQPYANPLMAPGDVCSEAPLLCGNYLNGYCGNNFGYSNNTPPPGYAGQGQKDAWLRIAACEPTVTLEVTVSDCNLGQGLKFALAKGTCTALTVLNGNLFQTVPANTTDTLTWTGALPDQANFLWINGVGGDECQFQIKVLDGIGTGTYVPGACTCTDGYVTGPDEVCPGDIVTFTLIPPSCNVLPGTIVGGGSLSCVPDGVCGTVATDTIVPLWHFSSPSMQFLSDSIGPYTVTMMVDTALSNVDTLINALAWVTWVSPSGGTPGSGTGGGPGGGTGGGPASPQDSLTFCDCDAGLVCSGGFSITPKQFVIKHEIEHEYCELTCVNPTCIVNGISYSSPGTYTQKVSNCKKVIVHISTNFQFPLLLPMPSQTICQGESATLTAQLAFPTGPVYFSWSNPASSSPSITVSPAATTTYTVTAYSSISGCATSQSVQVKVIPPKFTNLTRPLCPAGSVTVCNETFTEVGLYQIICTSFQGCDSTIFLNVLPGLPQVVNEGVVGTLTCVNTAVIHRGNAYTAPGNYTFEEDCKRYVFTILMDSNSPAATLTSSNSTLCEGQTALLTAASNSPGSSFSWSHTGNGSATQVVAPTANTTYQVTVTNQINGCTSTASTTVNVQPYTTTQLGVVGTVTCTQPCATFNNKSYCAPGTYADTVGCAISVFTIDFQKVVVGNGVVGTVTCAQPCVTFLGQNFCAAGDYTVEDACTIQHFTVAEDLLVPDVALTPVNLCGNACFDFYGQTICAAGVYYHFENCTRLVQVVTTTPYDVVSLGTVGTVTCAQPCFSFNGNNYCTAGNYADTVGCSITQFSIDFQKVVVENGVVGTVTCAQPCVTYLGQSYCAAGDYTVEDACTVQHFTVTEDLTVPDVVLPPVSLCVNACFDFFGQNICSAGTYYYLDNCTRLVQEVTVTPFTVNALGNAATLSCAQPCFSFNGQDYCVPGNYADTTACTITTFSLDFQKVVVENGVVGTITCAQPCVTYLGQSYCAAGDYTVEDDCTIQHFTVTEDLTVPDVVLPPVSLCANACFDFFGQNICAAGTYYHLDNCTRLVQVVTVTPFTVNALGFAATLSCDSPCFTFNGQDYCTPGDYADTTDCTITTFSLDFQKVLEQNGVVGTITCAQPCVTFLGQTYCAAGSYTLEDACTVQYFTVAEDLSAPACTAPAHNCLPSNTHYTVDFTITGLPPFKVNGNTLTSNYFQSAPLLNGTAYAFVVEQQNGCQTLVNGTFNCAAMCGGEVGLLVPNPVHACAGQTTVQAQSQTPPFAPLGQGIEFVFRTVAGDVLERNASGAFAFNASTMQPDTEYRLVRVVGPTDSNGQVDLNNGCTEWSNEQPAFFHAAPTVVVSGPAGVCGGESLTLEASGSGQLQWTVAVGSGSPIASANGQWNWPAGIQQSTTYTVTGSNTWGCSTSAQWAVELYPAPQIEAIDLTAPQCAGGADGGIEVLEVSGGLPNYEYALDNASFQPAASFSGLSAGAFQIKVRDTHGCQQDSTVLLHDPLPLTLDLGPDQEVFPTAEVELTASTSSTVASIVWVNESTGQQLNDSLSTTWRVRILGTTSFVCTITDGNGCQASDRVTLTARRDGQIYHPNVINPVDAENVDNQRFTLFAPPGWVTNIASLSIFDRWGEQVWQNRNLAANDPNQGWDGNIRGQRIEPGVYVFVAVVELVTGEEIVVKGDVTVVR